MYGINKNLKLHFIGIGGIGMSAIAKVLMNLGYRVSGSDLGEGETVLKLKKAGAEIFKGHKEENIQDVQIVVYSSAINSENPEIIKAKKLNIPLIKRAEMLAELMRLKYGLAIAGSHGKTTTTSFLATIMSGLNLDPTYIVGGLVKNLEDNAGIGKGELLIAEADESDGSFLYLNPIMSVITNIDNDHLDHYGSLENLKEAFINFSNKVPFYGVVALNANDKPSVEILNKLKRPHKFFGVDSKKIYSDSVDYLAKNIKDGEDGASFNLHYKEEVVEFKISLSGEHNIQNALGAIVLAHSYGTSLIDISKNIIKFEGVSRRQDKIFERKDFVIIDDYAHHPTEILATISTVKNRYQNKKVIVCFEPHRYTRTKNFWNDFVASFKDADKVYVSPIYAANEKPIEYIDSQVLVKSISNTGVESDYLEDTNEINKVFRSYKNENAVVLVLGAGAISKIAKQIVKDELQ